MWKRLVVCGVTAASLSMALAAFAQGGHGVPQPEKVYGDGVTWPIKIEVRKYDMHQLVAPPTLADDAQDGRLLFVQKCAYCHDGVGSPTYLTMGPWLGGEVVTNLGEDNVKSFITNGDVRMPAFRYNLTTEQIDHVIAFLKTVPSDQEPTAKQLAGRGEAGAASD
jgi:mono/diheme cytochrome c family protein